MLEKRYEITVQPDAYDTLKEICISRRCYLKGEELDIMKASALVVEDFRSGRLGRITIEQPPAMQRNELPEQELIEENK